MRREKQNLAKLYFVALSVLKHYSIDKSVTHDFTFSQVGAIHYLCSYVHQLCLYSSL